MTKPKTRPSPIDGSPIPNHAPKIEPLTADEHPALSKMLPRLRCHACHNPVSAEVCAACGNKQP